MFNALKVAVILTAVDKMSKVVGGAVDTSQRHLTRFSKATSKLGDQAFNLGQQAGMFGLAVGASLYMTVRAAEDAQAEVAKLEQGFKTMGDTSGKMAKKAQEFSSALMMEIAIDDEQIMAVEGKLATFEKVIKNSAGTAEIFERSTRAAFDMQAAGFGDAMSNATQLGKALGDPLKGMQALRKSGTLMQADIDRIGKEYQKTGNLLKAQRQIMDAIEKQVQGKAAANAKATEKIKIAFGEIAEQIGGALLPAVNRFAKWLSDTLPNIQKWIEKNKTLISNGVILAAVVTGASLAISGIAFVVGGFLKVLSFLSSAIGFTIKVFQFLGTVIRVVSAFMMANPIIAIITGIAVAALLIYMYWDKIKAFFLKLWEGVKQIFSRTWNWIKNLFLNYTPQGLVIKHWDKISGWFSNLWNRVKVAFAAFWQWAKNLFLNYTPQGLVIKHWEKIVGFFSNLWTRVKILFLSFVGFVMQLPAKFYKAGEAIVNSLWNGMKKKFNDMKNWFKSGLQDLRDMLPFSPAKRGPLKDIHKLKLVETIATNIKPGPMVSAMNKALSAVKGVAKGGGKGMSSGASPSMSAGNSSVVVNFAPVFNGGGASASGKQDFISQLKEYEPQLMRVINDALARQERKKFA